MKFFAEKVDEKMDSPGFSGKLAKFSIFQVNVVTEVSPPVVVHQWSLSSIGSMLSPLPLIIKLVIGSLKM